MRNPELRGRELIEASLLAALAGIISIFVLEQYRISLFLPQMAAAIAAFMGGIALTVSITRKCLPIKRLIQLLLIFLLFSFPVIALYRADHEPLIIDNFEGGVDSWDMSISDPHINATIETKSEYSSEGLWHLVWNISNPYPENKTVSLINNPPATFRLNQDYSGVEFRCRSREDGSFIVIIICPAYPKGYYRSIGTDETWKLVTWRLPQGNDNASLNGWSIGFKETPPDPSGVAHVELQTSSNTTLEIDDIRLSSNTFWEQHGLFGASLIWFVLLIIFTAFIYKDLSALRLRS
jgi:hypothetical protein